MIKPGQFNKLKVVKQVPFGIYLDGEEWGEILLPNKYVPKDLKLDSLLDVFIYFDSEDKIIATTLRPLIKLEQFAFLKVVDVNYVGAFLDWGLDKDLLAPRPEQRRPMEKGKSYIVYLKQDNQERLIASSNLDYVLDKSAPSYLRGEEVKLLIAEKTELGQKVIVNNSHWGLIHSADIFQPLQYGKKMVGYIKNIRDDGKIDITLRKMGHDKVYALAQKILIELNKQGGFLALHDKSSADDIMELFNESKKSFKSAIGQLYKQGKIAIEDKGIRLRK